MTGGLDWDFRFNKNRYSFEGITAFSAGIHWQPVKMMIMAMGGLVLRKREGVIDSHSPPVLRQI